MTRRLQTIAASGQEQEARILDEKSWLMSSRAVVNASPLIYLARADLFDLLRQAGDGIVSLLESLAPDRPLNAWFREIVEQGTGRVFTPDDNADWTRVTRPILEAFFHARFFLEMAVRYSTLLEPPMPLPSGYAAPLYLYGLR